MSTKVIIGSLYNTLEKSSKELETIKLMEEKHGTDEVETKRDSMDHPITCKSCNK